MIRFSLPAIALLAAATSVSAHWRFEATEVHKTGTYFNGATDVLRHLGTREVWLQQEFIDAHSNERAAHGANPLIWDDADYDPSNPQYSHWTQVVWKASTRLGCATASCAPGTIFPAEQGTTNYFVCHYDPAGNVVGQFAQNVQK